MPFEPSPGFIFGALLAMGGGIWLMIMLGRAGGMAFGTQSWRNLAAFFSDPNRKREHRVFGVAFAVTALGSCICMGTIAASDANENNQCREACELAGHPDGRVRANPHVKYEPGDPYACWCKNGPAWAAESMPLPEKAP